LCAELLRSCCPERGLKARDYIHVYAATGRKAEAQKLIEELRKQATVRYVDP
jgi:hypothetical protein